MTRRGVTATLVVMAIALGRVDTARAQGWFADVSAGRVVYDPVSASVGTNHMIGTVRYDARRDAWVYGAGAVPTDDAGTLWIAAGTGGRVMFPTATFRGPSFGIDIAGHAFSFRDRVVDLAGSGGELEAMPFARFALGAGFIEGRGGWRGHTLSFGGVRENRRVFETGARAGYGTMVRVEGDARWVHASEGIYPFLGATITYVGSRVDVWGQTGKWLADDLAEREWAFGSGVNLGVRTSVWGAVRQEAPDPLYWNVTRRTWSIGLTQRLGRVPAPLVPVAPSQAGTVDIRLDAADTTGDAVWIAGDFNSWQPTPMQREGDEWVVHLTLAPGVYHYAFRSSAGEWFVPPSAPGRRDDGMGGYVAVLVVN